MSAITQRQPPTMADLEFIATQEQYEAAREMAAKYEARAAEMLASINRKIAEIDLENAERLARPYEILNNLQSQLWALEAQCHDYELNEMHVAARDEEPKGSWTAEVINLQHLIQAAASNPEYVQYLQPNQVALNKLARKMKRTMYVPGVIATQKEKP